MIDSPLPLQSLLSAIVESSDDAIISKDLRGIVTSWNPAAERMFGYTAEEMLGRSIRTIIPADRQHEEDLVLAQMAAGKSVDHFETLRLRKGGTPIHISLSVSPIRDASGVVIGASKIARDISERIHAQESADRARSQGLYLARLAAAFSASLEPARRVSALAELSVPDLADWCAVDVLKGRGEIERVAIKSVTEDNVELPVRFAEGRGDPHAPANPDEVIRTGVPSVVPVVTDRMLVDAASGDEERLRNVRHLSLASYVCLPLLVRGRPIGAVTFVTAESGRHYDDETLWFLEDVTSRSALAFDNAWAYEDLQAANRMKDEFLATLSHELRTPLNAILGYARMLRSGILGGDREERAIEILERNATALTQIVEDLLDVSRIANGKIRLSVRPLDLSIVVGDALATMTPAAQAKNVRVESSVDPDVGPVSGDPDRLQQVMWNLLSNAVKFTPRGGHIQVRLRRANSHVEVTVSDTGMGIHEDFVPHLFERFRQADSTTTRVHGGLGLGLAIAREIVELHGGTIEASSGGEGKGATFRIELPLMPATHEFTRTQRRLQEPSRAEKSLSPSGFQGLSGVRVLAVDDDADARALICEVLETAGATVLTAASAFTALTLLKAESPDVLISDLSMPEMDGFELIEQVRRLDNGDKDIPAAALTAYARSEDRARALSAGFEMHLAKPIDPGELIAAVASLVKRRAGVGAVSRVPNPPRSR